MTESKDLIIITASCGKNLELSEKFLEKSNELKISSEILDLTTLDIQLTPNEQIIIPESLAWLDASVKERMECGDHWVIYAEVVHGNILKSDSLTAVHHRKTGASY